MLMVSFVRYGYFSHFHPMKHKQHFGLMLIIESERGVGLDDPARLQESGGGGTMSGLDTADSVIPVVDYGKELQDAEKRLDKMVRKQKSMRPCRKATRGKEWVRKRDRR